MKLKNYVSAIALAGLVFASHPASVFAASHREAPITALDQKADITDWYTFIDPERPSRVVMILNVDPFLEPSNGPNCFPFDPGILYEMKVDNNRDGKEDITFRIRFQTEVHAPGVFTGFVGNLLGIPSITALDGPGAAGLSLRQSYTVTMVKGGQKTDITNGKTLYAVPSNVGPRTMPDYNKLRAQGVYNLPNDISVFAGTVADRFFIDLGAAFDSLNFRQAAGGGVLIPRHDFDDATGPVADLLRINLGIPPTTLFAVKRLGALGGDFGGFPNGWRLNDDVVDIAARVVSGALAYRQFNTRIGDGVNSPAVQPLSRSLVQLIVDAIAATACRAA